MEVTQTVTGVYMMINVMWGFYARCGLFLSGWIKISKTLSQQKVVHKKQRVSRSVLSELEAANWKLTSAS